MKFKKVISGLLAASFAGTLTGGMAFAEGAANTYDVAASGVSTVQFEDKISTDHTRITNTNGGTSVFVENYDKTDSRYDVVILVYAEKSGVYSLDIVGSQYSTKGDNRKYLSWVWYTVNDDAEYASYDYRYANTVDMSDVANNFPIQKYDLLTPVYLNQGENMIKFSLGLRPLDQAGKIALFDYMEFTPVNTPVVGTSKPNAAIEIEDFDKWSAKDFTYDDMTAGKRWHMAGGAASAAGNRVIRTVVEAEEAGWCNLEIVGAFSATSEWLSPLYISRNGESYIQIKSDNSKVGDTVFTASSATWDMKKVSFTPSMYLKKGKNTIDLKLGVKNSAVYISLDKINVTYSKSVPTLGETGGTLEFANMTGQKTSSTNADDGSPIYFFQSPVESYSMPFIMNVTKAGWYDVDMTAANSTASPYLSPVKMDINGYEYNLQDIDMNGGKEDAGYKSSDNFPMLKFKKTHPVYLNKGEITVYANITKRTLGGCYALFEDITFTPTVIPSLAGDNASVVIEAESFDRRHLKDITGASGGKAIKYDGEAVSQYSSPIIVNVEKAGYYKLGAKGWFNLGDDELASKVAIQVNDGDITILDKNQNCTVTNAVSGVYAISELEMDKAIYLESGENIITYTVLARTTDNILCSLIDCFTLSEVELPVIEAGGGTVEFEVQESGDRVYPDDLASGGGYVLYPDEAATETPAVQKLMINVKQAGRYQMKFIGSAKIAPQSDAALSEVKIKINDKEEELLTSSNCTLNGDLYQVYWDSRYLFGNYTYKKDVWLNEGSNVISFTIVPNGGYNCAAFDALIFAPAGEIGNAEMDISEYLIEGAAEAVVFTDSEGKTFTNDNVYQITYGTSNEAAATVDGNGTVSARNCGKTLITAAVYPDKTTETPITVSKTVYVVSAASGIYVKNEAVSNGNVTADVVFTKAEVSSCKAAVAVYGSNGSLKDVQVADVTGSITANGSINVTLAGYTAGDSVKIILLNDFATMRPMWSAVSL